LSKKPFELGRNIDEGVTLFCLFFQTIEENGRNMGAMCGDDGGFWLGEKLREKPKDLGRTSPNGWEETTFGGCAPEGDKTMELRNCE
jgi:hypothetical protein